MNISKPSRKPRPTRGEPARLGDICPAHGLPVGGVFSFQDGWNMTSKNHVEMARAALRRVLEQTAEKDDPNGRWVTLDNGVHVFINKAGDISKGPAELTGKNLNNLDSGKKSAQGGPSTPPAVRPETPPEPAKRNAYQEGPEADQEKINQAREFLRSKGFHVPDAPVNPSKANARETAAPRITYMDPNKILAQARVKQFKAGADEATGEVEPLEGHYDHRGSGPLQIWEGKDGTMEVISGRHRLAHAKRNGVGEVPVQVYREADGFSLEQAKALDAELNIRDGNGSVADYASYFQSNKGLTKDQAQMKGLLARAKGKDGWDIAQGATETLLAALKGKAINDKQAAAIARHAPNDEKLQPLGLKLAGENKSAETIGDYLQAYKALSARRKADQDQGELFGNDDSAIKEMAENASKAGGIRRALAARITAAQGAAKRPDIAREMGINVDDPEAVKSEVSRLQGEVERWKNWAVHPDLVAQIFGKDPNEGQLVQMPDAPPEGRTVPEPLRSQEEMDADLEKTFSDKGNDQTPSMFGFDDPAPAPEPEKAAPADQRGLDDVEGVGRKLDSAELNNGPAFSQVDRTEAEGTGATPAPPPGLDLFGNPVKKNFAGPEMMTDLFGNKVAVDAEKQAPQETVSDQAAKGLDWLDQKQQAKTDGTGEMFGSLFSPGNLPVPKDEAPAAPPALDDSGSVVDDALGMSKNSGPQFQGDPAQAKEMALRALKDHKGWMTKKDLDAIVGGEARRSLEDEGLLKVRMDTEGNHFVALKGARNKDGLMDADTLDGFQEVGLGEHELAPENEAALAAANKGVEKVEAKAAKKFANPDYKPPRGFKVPASQKEHDERINKAVEEYGKHIDGLKKILNAQSTLPQKDANGVFKLTDPETGKEMDFGRNEQFAKKRASDYLKSRAQIAKARAAKAHGEVRALDEFRNAHEGDPYQAEKPKREPSESLRDGRTQGQGEDLAQQPQASAPGQPKAGTWQPSKEIPEFHQATGYKFWSMGGLTPEEKQQEAEFQAYARDNYEDLRHKYLQKKGAFDANGKLTHANLNIDDWRDFMPGYTGLNQHVNHTAANYLNARLLHELKHELKGVGNGKMAIMAGGGGSGKTTAVSKQMQMTDYPLILDQVSAEWDGPYGAKAAMDQARQAGFEPEFHFVDRHPWDAWEKGIVPRFLEGAKEYKAWEDGGKQGPEPEKGRPVDLNYAMDANIKARKAALEAAKEMAASGKPITVYNNNLGKGLAKDIQDPKEQIEYLGSQVHDPEELKKRAKNGILDLYRSGQISRDHAAGLIGGSPDEVGQLQPGSTGGGATGPGADERPAAASPGGTAPESPNVAQAVGGNQEGPSAPPVIAPEAPGKRAKRPSLTKAGRQSIEDEIGRLSSVLAGMPKNSRDYNRIRLQLWNTRKKLANLPASGAGEQASSAPPAPVPLAAEPTPAQAPAPTGKPDLDPFSPHSQLPKDKTPGQMLQAADAELKASGRRLAKKIAQDRAQAQEPQAASTGKPAFPTVSKSGTVRTPLAAREWEKGLKTGRFELTPPEKMDQEDYMDGGETPKGLMLRMAMRETPPGELGGEDKLPSGARVNQYGGLLAKVVTGKGANARFNHNKAAELHDELYNTAGAMDPTYAEHAQKRLDWLRELAASDHQLGGASRKAIQVTPENAEKIRARRKIQMGTPEFRMDSLKQRWQPHIDKMQAAGPGEAPAVGEPEPQTEKAQAEAFDPFKSSLDQAGHPDKKLRAAISFMQDNPSKAGQYAQQLKELSPEAYQRGIDGSMEVPVSLRQHFQGTPTPRPAEPTPPPQVDDSALPPATRMTKLADRLKVIANGYTQKSPSLKAQAHKEYAKVSAALAKLMDENPDDLNSHQLRQVMHNLTGRTIKGQDQEDIQRTVANQHDESGKFLHLNAKWKRDQLEKEKYRLQTSLGVKPSDQEDPASMAGVRRKIDAIDRTIQALDDAAKGAGYEYAGTWKGYENQGMKTAATARKQYEDKLGLGAHHLTPMELVAGELSGDTGPLVDMLKRHGESLQGKYDEPAFLKGDYGHPLDNPEIDAAYSKLPPGKRRDTSIALNNSYNAIRKAIQDGQDVPDHVLNYWGIPGAKAKPQAEAEPAPAPQAQAAQPTGDRANQDLDDVFNSEPAPQAKPAQAKADRENPDLDGVFNAPAEGPSKPPTPWSRGESPDLDKVMSAPQAEPAKPAQAAGPDLFGDGMAPAPKPAQAAAPKARKLVAAEKSKFDGLMPWRDRQPDRTSFHRTHTPDGKMEADALVQHGNEAAKGARANGNTQEPVQDFEAYNLGERYNQHLNDYLKEMGADRGAFDAGIKEGPSGKYWANVQNVTQEAGKRVRAEINANKNHLVIHNTDGVLDHYHGDPADLVPGGNPDLYPNRRRRAHMVLNGPKTDKKALDGTHDSQFYGGKNAHLMSKAINSTANPDWLESKPAEGGSYSPEEGRWIPSPDDKTGYLSDGGWNARQRDKDGALPPPDELNRQILQELKAGTIDKAEAFSRLNAVDRSVFHNYVGNIRTQQRGDSDALRRVIRGLPDTKPAAISKDIPAVSPAQTPKKSSYFGSIVRMKDGTIGRAYGSGDNVIIEHPNSSKHIGKANAADLEPVRSLEDVRQELADQDAKRAQPEAPKSDFQRMVDRNQERNEITGADQATVNAQRLMMRLADVQKGLDEGHPDSPRGADDWAAKTQAFISTHEDWAKANPDGFKALVDLAAKVKARRDNFDDLWGPITRSTPGHLLSVRAERAKTPEELKGVLTDVMDRKGDMALRSIATDHGVPLGVNPGGKGTDMAHGHEIIKRIMAKRFPEGQAAGGPGDFKAGDVVDWNNPTGTGEERATIKGPSSLPGYEGYHVIQMPGGNTKVVHPSRLKKVDAAQGPSAPPPVAQNFEQYLKANKIKDPGADHGPLSPNGRVSGRSRNAMIARMDADHAAFAKARADYRAKVEAGEVVDPTGRVSKSPAKPSYTRGVTQERLDSYDPEHAVFRHGNRGPWYTRDLRGNAFKVGDETKLGAILRARQHHQLMKEYLRNPQAYGIQDDPAEVREKAEAEMDRGHQERILAGLERARLKAYKGTPEAKRDQVYKSLLQRARNLGGGMYEVKDVPAFVLNSLRSEADQKRRMGGPQETTLYSLREKSEVTGNRFDQGYILKVKTPENTTYRPKAAQESRQAAVGNLVEWLTREA